MTDPSLSFSTTTTTHFLVSGMVRAEICPISRTLYILMCFGYYRQIRTSPAVFCCRVAFIDEGRFP